MNVSRFWTNLVVETQQLVQPVKLFALNILVQVQLVLPRDVLHLAHQEVSSALRTLAATLTTVIAQTRLLRVKF